ncbi:MAG: S8 family serine peptidase [Anaerolineales bacterium]|nr:S8 family serine peptidase [Anaerolineales bacterium]
MVANIDSGVDWTHPALQTKYRGYTGAGKLPQHLGNWFDATGQGATYPIDGNGHGSHTMGTMVADSGLGVAPGAKWIAVKAFDSSGGALNSWLHSAFQWVLAPNGNPALAPDLVNNSWSSNAGSSTEFQADIQALLNAGIYPIFAAGNNGSDPETVGSPGSLNIALAVGATDINDEVALFSGRGPSPWGKIKPEIAAPGKEVLSTIPGGAYSYLNGTSMAAPHVAGVIALMLQASPSLSSNLSLISQVLTSTAVPLDSPIPNNNSGWGRLDAYNAVMAVGSFGTIQGSVTQAGLPIGGATLQITSHGGGPAIYATTTVSGTYLQGLAPGVYDVTASAFGYNPVTEFALTVASQTPTVQNFSLTRQPTGSLAGVVRETGTGQPLVASITIAGTPAQATSGPDGSYSITLPEGAGSYTATVVAAAHRITQVVGLTINDGGVTSQDFWLDPAPKILLVDSGPWYQESEIGYYQQALTDLRYPYDTWSITNPAGTPNDVPVTSTLTAYDIVVWSAPLDSPGYIGADAPLRGYLSQGGKLLLSGQDVAFFDGGGSIFGDAPYFRGYLKAQYLEETSEVFSATGVITSPFAGLSLTITGGDGANNQVKPDVIENINSDFARNLLTYGNDGGLAGVFVGLCVPYRVAFLPFGFEAINSQTDRSQTLARTLDWLTEPPAPAGLELSPAQQTVIGNFGAVATHTVRIRNIGATPATFNLSLSSGTPYNWPVNPAPPPNLSLTSCQSQTITMGMQININNTWHVSDTRTLTVQAAGAPTISGTVTHTTKARAGATWLTMIAGTALRLNTKQPWKPTPSPTITGWCPNPGPAQPRPARPWKRCKCTR